RLRVNGTFSFAQEKEKLLQVLHRAFYTTSDSDWYPHPLLGSLHRKQWGILITKHLDHHLRQYGK
ncbi:MAG: DUF1569 domain-containing protein, partial [Chitinophagales bacterium]